MRRRGVLVLVLAVTSACVAHRPASGPARTRAGDPGVYVAVGASETVGAGADSPVTEAWPQLFYRVALPRAAVFVNLGIPGATVAEAIDGP